MNSTDESEALREARGPDVNPATKEWLKNVLVPAMVKRWIDENGGKVATTDPPSSEMTVKS